VNKKVKKKIDKRCYFCGEGDYDLLDCHRIIPGEEGGEYNEHNTVVACACCHRKCHSGRINIIGRFFSTMGYVLHYFEDGVEKFK
jgi:hypothetical protein